MRKNTRADAGAEALMPIWETLEAFIRGQVQGIVQRALEEEVTAVLGREWYERREAVDEPAGYRNGHGKPRRVALLTGTIEVRRPRLRGLAERFESRVLPLFQRRSSEVGELLMGLYLHGLSQGDFTLALRGLLGEGAPLSAASIERLRADWQVEYAEWRARPLADRELVYLWADGIYVKAGLETEKAALLVVIGAMSDGRKEVLSVVPGYRESTEAWAAVLRDLRERGLGAPKLVVADGHLGIWGAVREVWPEAAEQRCWNHKITNVRARLPKKAQREAGAVLAAIPYASTRAEAEKRRDAFAAQYRGRYPEAVRCLEDDWERLMTFYGFPEAHWRHLRTTNVVESPFAALRLRTGAAKRFRKVTSATCLIWKALMVAETIFRRLHEPQLAKAVYDGLSFIDGQPVTTNIAGKVAA